MAFEDAVSPGGSKQVAWLPVWHNSPGVAWQGLVNSGRGGPRDGYGAPCKEARKGKRKNKLWRACKNSKIQN